MPLVPETLLAITRAELPERGVPRRAVALPGARAGRDQPAPHNLLEEPVPEQPLTINAAQILLLEYAVAALVKLLEGGERCGQLFIRRGHKNFPSGPSQVLSDVQVQVYDAVLLQVNDVESI